MNFPKLMSNSQVAARLGITRQNMPNKRKTKGFPEPVLTVDSFPLWLAEDIEKYVAEREAKASQKLSVHKRVIDLNNKYLKGVEESQ